VDKNKRGYKEMKTTQLQRQQASTGKDIGKLSSSLLHSIRHDSVYLKIDDNGQEVKMWDKEKSHLNYIMLGGVMVAMDSLNNEEKEKIVNGMIEEELSDLSGENLDTDLIADIADKNNKVKKQASNLKRKKGLFSDFADLKDSHISDATLDYFKDEIRKDPDMIRVEQKIKPMDAFQKENNKLVKLREKQKDFKIDKNRGLIQESFLKFPQMPNGTISKEKHTEILESYFTENFPDYKIKGSFFHGDEKSLNIDGDLEDCGNHPHIFVSCKNSKTGKYTLIKEQKLKAIEHIKKNPNFFPGIDPDKLKTSYKYHKSPRNENGDITGAVSPENKAKNREMSRYMKALGIATQALILEHGQKALKKEGVELFRNEYKTEAEKERLKQLEKDSKVPKHLRENNSHKAELDSEKRELEHVKKQTKKLKGDNFKYGILIGEKQKSLKGIDKNIEHKYKTAMYSFMRDADAYIDNGKDELKEMVDYIDGHENKEFLEKNLKENKFWGKIIDKVEDSITDNNSILRKVHNSASKFDGYKNLFNDTLKPLYFEKYKDVKGESHKLDTGTGSGGADPTSLVNDKISSVFDNPFDHENALAGLDFMGDDFENAEQVSSKGIGTTGADDFMEITKKNQGENKKRADKENKNRNKNKPRFKK
jgi:hypothetical protein